MPIKYIPYYPNTVEGQAILDNITRTRRILSYRENDKVYEKIKRGMPFYEVETIEIIKNEKLKIENSAEKISQLKNNLVIRGECISACAFLKDQGIKVDLVYIDPPFASGADYAKKVYIRRNPKLAEKIKQAEQEMDNNELRAFEEKMYGDIWKKEDYLNWMYENLKAIKTIMNNTASIYVHLDWHIVHYVKILMDEVFGEDNFRNEIIWHYRRWSADSDSYQKMHDSILFYSKNESFTLNPVFVEPTEGQKKKHLKGWDRNTAFIDGKRQPQLLVYNQEKVDEAIKIKQIDKNEYARIVKVKVNETIAPDVWTINYINSQAKERLDYATQKPEALLDRIIKASSNKGMIVADLFGGSGVTAKVANDLNRKFIHCDVGVNSIQTTRDRLIEAGAEFKIMEIKDGISLFRNPVQTMEKIAKLIPGLQQNIEGIGNFWFGAIQNSGDGIIPVYVPNLLDSKEKVLDIPIINRIINQELQNLEVYAKKVIVYYIDFDDYNQIEKFIRDNNITEIKVELKDLKNLLNEVVLEDIIEFDLSEKDGIFEIEITKFISDRLMQKISEFNEKGQLQSITKGKKFAPIEISEEGLELIEMISLDCTNKEGIWKSDNEIKINKLGFIRINGKKTKFFWDGKIQSEKKPLRIKVRNISGDESVFKVK